MKVLESIDFHEVLTAFRAEHDACGEYLRNTNRSAELGLLQADRSLGCWSKVLLDREEIRDIFLPWHESEGGAIELVPRSGLTVGQAADNISRMRGRYAALSPVCWSKIERAATLPCTPLFASTRAIATEDYEQLVDVRGLVHLDGLHRAIAYEMFEVLAKERVMAYVATSSETVSKGWEIFCDFDGTISRVDVVDSLLEQFADPSWQDVEREWENGEIGSRECLSRQIRLLDMTRKELDEHIDGIEIDPDFPSFVEEARLRGHHIVVVSDGIEYAVRRILKRHRVLSLPIVANDIVEEQAGWSGLFPYFEESCRTSAGHCKCATIEKVRNFRDGGRKTLLIGDGASDFCAAGSVDMVLAKDRLVGKCMREKVPHRVIEQFSDARRWLEEQCGDEERIVC
jgi:2-hydroxy-3-keto-5-methylthiopentenyl-1-phosphate phosphatase